MMKNAIPDPARPRISAEASLAALFHPLPAVLLVAAAIRVSLAFWPNVLHPDEIFQYLEPAWRMLGHDGIVSWEWRYGMRGWLLPTLMAGPVALGDWAVPAGTGAFIVPRLAAALASLSIVASAWYLGARVSRIHAILAAFVAAIWFEFVSFAPHTLSEPLATAVILPAALLLTRPTLSQKQLAAGGALLALAFVFRFQYAPALAVLALGACWRRWRNLLPLTAGGSFALLLGGAADAMHGAAPFAWLIANVQQNLLHDRAAEFGVTPAITYLYGFWMMWSAATVPLLIAIRQGWRHAPLLLATAVVNIAFHSMIGHKEYRFIFLSVVLLVIIAALGSADWVQRLRATRDAWRRWALPAAAGGWALIFGALAATGTMPDNWVRGTGAARLAAVLRNDAEFCGLALYETPFHLLPGRDRLAGRSPLYGLHPADPVAGDLAAAARQAAPAFNRILAWRNLASDLPAEFSQRDCAIVDRAEVCIFARSGGCDAAAAAPFVLNDVLLRVDR